MEIADASLLLDDDSSVLFVSDMSFTDDDESTEYTKPEKVTEIITTTETIRTRIEDVIEKCDKSTQTYESEFPVEAVACTSVSTANESFICNRRIKVALDSPVNNKRSIPIFPMNNSTTSMTVSNVSNGVSTANESLIPNNRIKVALDSPVNNKRSIPIFPMNNSTTSMTVSNVSNVVSTANESLIPNNRIKVAMNSPVNNKRTVPIFPMNNSTTLMDVSNVSNGVSTANESLIPNNRIKVAMDSPVNNKRTVPIFPMNNSTTSMAVSNVSNGTSTAKKSVVSNTTNNKNSVAINSTTTSNITNANKKIPAPTKNKNSRVEKSIRNNSNSQVVNNNGYRNWKVQSSIKRTWTRQQTYQSNRYQPYNQYNNIWNNPPQNYYTTNSNSYYGQMQNYNNSYNEYNRQSHYQTVPQEWQIQNYNYEFKDRLFTGFVRLMDYVFQYDYSNDVRY